MSADKAGQYVCLTTLDYAVRGSLMSTHCPSCGLRLIIKHDNIVNRVTSVSLLLGMSMLIGYNLGAHSGWIQQLSSRVLKLFGFGGDKDQGGSGKDPRNKLKHEQMGARSAQSKQTNSHVQSNGKAGASGDDTVLIEEIDETQMSDLTCDSAIDMRDGLVLPGDGLDDQLIELLSYNDFYVDLYNNNDSLTEVKDNGDDSPRKRLRTKTVDRIDQVLHQIDDIKKSIVEIDDELYHIAGSTYANFNPDFLTLTNTIVDDFDKEDDLLEAAPHYKLSEDRASLTKVQLEEVSRKLTESMQQQEPNSAKPKQRKLSRSDTLYKSGNQSHASFSDVDSLQLEWDFDFESGYDYYDAQKTDSDTEVRDRKQSPLREKLSSAASGLDMPMTDEQKLKNMHDLLDEAKKQGLLNNIIDALAPSQETSHQYKRTSEQMSTKQPKYSLGKS